MSYKYNLLCLKCNEVSALLLEQDVYDTDFPIRLKCPYCSSQYNLYLKDCVSVKSFKVEKYFEIIDTNKTRTLTGLISEIRHGYDSTMSLVKSIGEMINKESDEFTMACVREFDKVGVLENGIDKRYLASFFKQPFFSIPIFSTDKEVSEFNKLLFVPKFIKPKLGFIAMESVSHYIYIVNQFTMFTFELPDELRKYIGLKPAPDLIVQGKKIVGTDLPLFKNEISDFTCLDIDDSEDHLSVVVTSIDKSFYWLVKKGIKPTKRFIFKFNTENEKLIDSSIPHTEDQIIWYNDFRRYGRIICSGGPKDDFINMILQIIEIAYVRILIVIDESDDYTDRMFSNSIDRFGQLTILYTREHEEKLRMTPDELNRFSIIAIDADTWNGYGYESLLEYRNGLLIYTSNPLLDCLGDMVFSLLIHGMATYTSFGTYEIKQKKEEVSSLLTSSVNTLNGF